MCQSGFCSSETAIRDGGMTVSARSRPPLCVTLWFLHGSAVFKLPDTFVVTALPCHSDFTFRKHLRVKCASAVSAVDYSSWYCFIPIWIKPQASCMLETPKAIWSHAVLWDDHMLHLHYWWDEIVAFIILIIKQLTKNIHEFESYFWRQRPSQTRFCQCKFWSVKLLT